MSHEDIFVVVVQSAQLFFRLRKGQQLTMRACDHFRRLQWLNISDKKIGKDSRSHWSSKETKVVMVEFSLDPSTRLVDATEEQISR